jgi:uncharacterized protein YggE
MKAFIPVALALLLLSVLAAAQATPTVTAQMNTVFVGADGKFETAPDTALVQFNIAVQEEKSTDAYAHASQAAEQVRHILRANGLDPKLAQVGFLQIQPVYDWRTAKRKLVGYRVSTAVRLKLKDFSKISPILEQLAGMDYTEGLSLSYTLDDMDAAKVKAVEDAYRRAREEAQAVAMAGGRTLGEVSYASVDTYEQVRVLTAPAPSPMMMKAAGAEAAPAPTAEFSPQQIVVTAHVNAMFTLK